MNKKPKIIKGRSISAYFSRFGKGYINADLDVEDNIKKLKPNKKYWEIDGKYYQVNHSHTFKLLGCILGGVGIVTSIITPILITTLSNKETYHPYNFKYWNECSSLNVLKNFVEESVSPNKSTYIPKEDRIATFDMDGTLYGERAPIYIEWLMFDDYLNNVVPEKKQTSVNVEYKSGVIEPMTLEEIDTEIKSFMSSRSAPSTLEMEEAWGGAELFSGLTIPKYIDYVDSFLDKSVSEAPYKYFSNLKFKDMFYLPMIEVVEFLQTNNFDVYIVSGTDRFMVRDIVNKHLSIASNKVIGMDVSLEWDKVNQTVVRGNKLKYKNVEDVKVELITQEIGKTPVLSFGNSKGDCDMHDLCLSNKTYKTQAFMVNNDDNVREYEHSRKWDEKYNTISMQNDWKTIYGYNVEKIGK